jgi:hypothetical protein
MLEHGLDSLLRLLGHSCRYESGPSDYPVQGVAAEPAGLLFVSGDAHAGGDAATWPIHRPPHGAPTSNTTTLQGMPGLPSDLAACVLV